jgi:hypothetical protein
MPGVTEKTTKNVIHDNRSPDWDFNPKPPEYEAEMLTTHPRLRNDGL